MKRMLAENPAALVTFLKTENPMVRHYANMWRDGLRLDLDQVYERQGIERENMAAVLRKFKAQIKSCSPSRRERTRSSPTTRAGTPRTGKRNVSRSEEHTSELQSLMRISYAVFCLKKKKSKPHEKNHEHSTN